ncbi:KN motif and ankyrin repeat domain-containing protein 4 [Tachyglossus aculeatus]|uniref:KN motif and ankyrin repeat domain-containing protein 4 n=1 Tax=Tachyglossus aculeatus TaxID=9261 RepID=UPI0018F7BC26|nr:KN motif and ankyrin repeat domain-containing protein 4 [Tachyglossus aculeatus]
MERTHEEGQPPPGDGRQGPAPNDPYSVETPYGFHLDLDFLKYVDDIEKGNTIRRICVRRKAKQAKFSTLPRNFSLPDEGRRPGRPPSGPAGPTEASVETGPVARLPPPGDGHPGPFCGPQLQVATGPEEAGGRGRPQLLRASSMPVALPDGSDEAGPKASPARLPILPRLRDEAWVSEGTFGPAPAVPDALGHPPPPRHRGREAEEPMPTVSERSWPEVDLPPGEEEEASRPPMASPRQDPLTGTEGPGEDAEARLEGPFPSPPPLPTPALENQLLTEIELNVGEVPPPGKAAARSPGLDASWQEEEGPGGVAALKEQVAELERELERRTEALQRARAALRRRAGEVAGTARTEGLGHTEPGGPPGRGLRDATTNTEPLEGGPVRASRDEAGRVRLPEAGEEDLGLDVARPRRAEEGGESAETLPLGPEANPESPASPPPYLLTELKIEEGGLDGRGQEESPGGKRKDGPEGEDGCSASGPDPASLDGVPLGRPERGGREEPRPGGGTPADATLGQYVKKIQELLQEQWLCLQHGYPELASAIKQPASKLSSIQCQLVNSLNLLLSAYSKQAPARDPAEDPVPDSRPPGMSPSPSLRSIMKKKESGFPPGSPGTKKNLQFVGVNGGYETTSSEETSGEDSPAEGLSDSEAEGRCEAPDRGSVRDAAETSRGPSETPGLERGGSGDRWAAGTPPRSERSKPSEEFLSGCQLLSRHLADLKTSVDPLVRRSYEAVSQEWFRVSGRKSSSPAAVAAYLEGCRAVHPAALEMLVNLADGNGNTALHYSVSHSNFSVVERLLETGVCHVDLQNHAGYTAVMITPLAAADTEEDAAVVLRLLREGDVNIRASQGGQTALMLGVSHDRGDMVRALLRCRADVNLQDHAGTSALMLAARHANADMTRILLSHPGCDASLTDKAGRSALSIALRSPGQGEVAELLRAHVEGGGSARP